MDGTKKQLILRLLPVVLCVASVASAQLMPFTFPCSYSSGSDEGDIDEGEVALSVSILGNPSHYVPQQVYQVTLSSSSHFTQVQVIGLYESSSSSTPPVQFNPNIAFYNPASSVCTLMHQHHSISAQKQSMFLWMAPPAGTGCVNFMVTAVSYQQLLFKDLMALQLCEAGMPTPSPFRPQLAMVHSDGVILRDDFDSSSDLDYTIWSEMYGGNISDVCGSVLHGNSAVFCNLLGRRELNTVHLNTSTASALQFAISSGHCTAGDGDYSITVSYAVNERVDWHIIEKVRAPADGSTSIHIVHLPLAARTEDVCLRFHQDLAMDAHSYSGCWALDNILITNMAHRPASLQEDFDPIDPARWLFFPGGAVREKCQSHGNALYFRGDGAPESEDYQFVTSHGLNLWRDVHVNHPLFSQEFESMEHLVDWEVSGAAISTMCDVVHVNNSLVMNGLDKRHVCTPYLNATSMGNLRFYYIMGGGSCDPADSEDVQVAVYAYISGQRSPVLLHELPHDSYKKPQLVSLAIPPSAQSPSTKFCLMQHSHHGLNRNVWAIDDLYLLPLLPTNPTAHLQFGINLQCGSGANPAEIHVEFSTDQGRSWSLVQQQCLPGVCKGLVSPDDSVFVTGHFSGRWKKVTLPLPTAALTKHTRFRWRQGKRQAADTKWALDNVYIGEACGSVMCNGHGKCSNSGCRCDMGYSGDVCQISVSQLPTNLTEKFEEFSDFEGNANFSVILGGAAGYQCGVLASGKAFVFNQDGRRELITREFNSTNTRFLQFTVRIGSHGTLGSCRPPDNPLQSVFVLSSCNNGIMWTLIKHLEFDSYKSAKTVLIHLPDSARADSCRIRWWQPSHGGENQGTWALDDISLTRSLHNTINLDFTDHRAIRRALTFHTGEIGEACNRRPVLVLPRKSPPIGASVVETQSLQIGASFMIQFYLAVGCGHHTRRHSQAHNFSIHLEYSTDHGQTWHEVIPACMPGQVGCSHYEQGSTYHSTEYPDWTRISVPLPAKLRFAFSRFRLRQSHHAVGATWAIRHLYIGEQCPDMCHGHGVCQEGLCRCDTGYTGESCIPQSPRLTSIQSTFEEAGALQSDWLAVYGGSVSCEGRGCGTISSGCSLYFYGPGIRQLVSHDLNTIEASYVQFYIRIGGDNDGRTCTSASSRMEGVLLQYSTNRGITWKLLLELYYQDYTMPRFVRKDLPPEAMSLATRLRWRQPQHGGAFHSQWAVDDVFIGSDYRLQTLEASFVNDGQQPDIWMSTSSGQVGGHCRSDGPALFFNTPGEDRFAVTRSMQLTTQDVVQFKVVVGCQEDFLHYAPVYLEISSDGGLHWELVTGPCYPFAEGDRPCDGNGAEFSEGSIYHSGKYNSWKLVVVPVTGSMAHSDAQFRWWQAADPLAPTFGLDDVYIGQACPSHCSGHGVCRNAECECDSGYHGPSCTPKGNNPTSLSDGFDTPGLGNRQWAHTLGARPGQECGIIKMDNSLYFSASGPREAQTAPVNTTSIKIVQFYIQIGSPDQGDQCSPAVDRSEAVIIQYTNNSGITWHTLKVLDPTTLGQRSTQVTIELPASAKTPDTTFRWWQPFVSFDIPRAQWALDNVVIGANETRSFGFSDDFRPNPSDNWYMIMGGNNKQFCGSQEALVFDGVTEMPRYSETWDFQITMTAFLQFDLAMGCGGTPSLSAYAVLLEYSLDMGKTWHLVTENCAPPDMGCGGYRMGSVYVSQMHMDWTRVTVYLPEAAVSSSTRFRWSQPQFRPSRDVWAIDNIHLGNGCPWMCSGHGHCHHGQCVCDPGYMGAYCVPSIPLPKQLKDSFDGSPIPDPSRWLHTYGMALSNQCGVLVSGNAAVFNGPGVRMVVTQDLDSTMMEYFQFTFQYGCHGDMSSSSRSSAILVQYSINGGITWDLLQEMPHTTPLPSTFFNVKLPMFAKTNSTRFRFWQPHHAPRGEAWAIDAIIIGGNLMKRGMLQDTFDLYVIDDDDWLFHPGATSQAHHCPRQQRRESGPQPLRRNEVTDRNSAGTHRPPGEHPSLVFPRSIGEHSVTTRDIDVNDHTMVQFEINVGCMNETTASNPVRLEFSRDFGSTWHLLRLDCFSNQSTSLSCSDHLTPASIYYSGETEKWDRHTIPLTGLHICGTVRFRWYQGYFTAADNPKPWALDGIYIGPQCPDRCHGHGSCLNGVACLCDPGYGGRTCHAEIPNPFFLKESFEATLDPRKFSRWSGAEITQKCGTLITGKSLHFTGAGRRMLTTVDMDLTMASAIHFYIRLGCARLPPSHKNHPILLQSSSDGGISWNLIEEMTFDPTSNAAMYVALPLPDKARTNATRIRWWQPSREGAYIDEWAIDQIFIGGFVHGQMVLEDDFTTSLQHDGDQQFSLHDRNWMISPGSAMEQVCGVGHNALHFASNELMRYTVTSDVMVTEDTFLQFDIAMGCTQPQACYGILLEYSLDMGQHWQALYTECLPSQVECTSYHMRSVFLADVYYGWNTVTIVLPQYTRSKTTRFRWSQPPRFDPGQQWALSNVYIGSECDDLCSGHGHCRSGICICDHGWEGTSCQRPSTHLPQTLRDTFAREPISGQGHWSKVNGAVLSGTCGPVASGRALHFRSACTRQLMTSDLDLTQADYVQFYFRFGCVAPPRDRDEGVMVEYSVNGGTMWHHLSELFHNQYQSATFVSLTLPSDAHHNGTRLRWWQPTHSGPDSADWAIDNIFIGGSTTLPNLLRDAFEVENLQEHWLFSDNARLGSFCASEWGQDRATQPLSNTVSWIGGINPAESSSLTTQDLILQSGDVLEFKISIGCNASWDSTIRPIHLIYSVDHGIEWSMVTTQCLLSEPRCKGVVTPPSIFYSFLGWQRVILPLTEEMTGRPVRFRWFQDAASSLGVDQRWALDDVRIGQPCQLMCSGHGSCNFPVCICDEGFQGDFCESSLGLQTFLKEEVVGAEMKRGNWPLVQGAVITKGSAERSCDVLREGRSLYFSGDGMRVAEMVPLDLRDARFIQFYIVIGSKDNDEACITATTRSESVILQYSVNGGIGWNLLKELDYQQYRTPQYEYISLPVKARTDATHIRWWQPIDMTKRQAEWALDNILIGGSEINPNEFIETFEHGEGQLLWDFHPFGQMERGICHEQGTALYWSNERNAAYDSSATSRQLIVDKKSIIQFKIVVGCQNTPSCTITYPVTLEYSTDPTRPNWRILRPSCLPGDEDDVRCNPLGYHDGSEYTENEYHRWQTVTLDLPDDAVSSSTQFRWIQRGASNVAPSWAVDNLYIGEECPDMCNGHGQCTEGPRCVCEQGYQGDSCLPATTLPTYIRYGVHQGSIPSMDPWSKIQGGVVGQGCGPLEPHAHGLTLYFGGCGMRQAVTLELDTRRVVEVGFVLQIGSNNPNNASCHINWNTPDIRSKAVLLQYTLNNGIHWHLIQTHDPEDFFEPVRVSHNLPLEARAVGLRLRWWQPKHDGENHDQWALDNIELVSTIRHKRAVEDKLQP